MKLGRFETNKIYCEDTYKAIKEIPDKSIDLIVTDPPYLIESTKAGGGSPLAKSIQRMNDQLASGTLTNSINTKILDEFLRVMKKVNIYIWCNHKQIPMYLDFFVTKHQCSFDVIIWSKTNATPLFCNKYLTDKEYCLYFRRGGYCNPSSYEKAKTVYELPINLEDKKKYLHPTIKPLNIIKNLIENSSKENDIILDAFMGSGTTAVACQELGRQFIGFEIEPKFYKIACERLEGLTQEEEKVSSKQLSIFDL